MDDTQQITNSKSQITNANDNTLQGQTLVQFPQTPQQGQVQQPTNAPIAGMPKEQEPFPTKQVSTEFLTASENKAEIDVDLEQAGVTETPQTPHIPEEVLRTGVAQSGTAVPPPTQSATPLLKLPIDPVKAETVTKGSFFFKNPTSSLLWLALVVLRQLKMKKREEETHAS